MKGFGSDNHAGVHPELMQAILECNIEQTPSYGTDPWTEKAVLEFHKLFGKKVPVYFVYNGTAANVLCVRSMIKPWQSVFCSDLSHLNVDECGAPEFMSGGKLIPLPANNEGKLTLEILKENFVRRGDQHTSQVKAISLTQPTEVGTCYSLEEIQNISQWAHANGLYLHIDGARLANAVLHLQTSHAEMLTKIGVDIVSFGGTKNALMMGEAVVFLNSNLAEDFIYIRKQSAQLPSKTRFISAQFQTYLATGLWKKIAAEGLRKAQLLFEQTRNIPGVEITYPVQSNAVFAKIPKHWVKPLREKFFFYVWNEKTFECRWMISFDTLDSEIMSFASELKALSQHDLLL